MRFFGHEDRTTLEKVAYGFETIACLYMHKNRTVGEGFSGIFMQKFCIDDTHTNLLLFLPRCFNPPMLDKISFTYSFLTFHECHRALDVAPTIRVHHPSSRCSSSFTSTHIVLFIRRTFRQRNPSGAR